MSKATDPRWIALPEQELVSGYLESCQSAGKLAAKYGVSVSTIHNRLRHLGVPRRSLSDARRANRQMGESSPRWVGGRVMQGKGYVGVLDHNHHRAFPGTGYVLEHAIIVERALGHPLDAKHPIHHVNEGKTDNRNGNLVVCENEAYHRLLHARMRVAKAGGNPNLDKICCRCKKLKPLTDFSIHRSAWNGVYGECRICRSAQRRSKYWEHKERTNARRRLRYHEKHSRRVNANL